MTWDELLNMEFENGHDGQVLTDIDCPACGRKIYFNSRIVLTTYPAKYSYWCRCGWSDCSYIKWGDFRARMEESE